MKKTRLTVLLVLNVAATAFLVVSVVLWMTATPWLFSPFLTGTARRPLVLIGGQTEQLPTVDYLSSPGGGSMNGTPPVGAGDLVADTLNGLYVTGTGGTGGVSVSQATTAYPNPGWKTVNLTTEGTIDWIIPDGSNATVQSCSDGALSATKAAGGRVLGCGPFGGIAPWVAGAGGNGLFGGTCSNCAVVLTYTLSDQTSVNASPGINISYRGWNNFGGTLGDWGWYFKAPARTTQLVLRQYVQLGNMTNAYCTGTLSDGSGTATSPAISASAGNYLEVALTWTYHSATPGATFLVVCHMNSGVSTSPTMIWYAETLGVI